MTKKNTYNESDIQVLTDHEHIRKRTAMYLGQMSAATYNIPLFINEKFNVSSLTFTPSILKCVGEILDNCIDEHIQNSNNNTVINIDAQPLLGTYTISDNGRGVPIGKHESGKFTPEIAFGSLKSGRNFSDNKQSGVIGMNGIGSSAVCAVSTEFAIDIHRDGKRYRQTFSDGASTVSKPIIRKSTNTTTGTAITFQLDGTIFDDVSLSSEIIENKAIEVALTNPGITTTYNNNTYKFKRGFDDIIAKLSNEYFKFSVDGIEYYVMFDMHEGIDESIFSWVNSSLLYDGGLCNTQFLNAFYDRVITGLSKESKKHKCEVTKNDIRQNLLVLGNLKISDPEYDAQSKTRLTGPNLRKEMGELLSNNWTAFTKKHKEWLSKVLERSVLRHNANASKQALKNHQKNSPKNVHGLVDATGNNRYDCQLLVTEGDCLHEDTRVKVVVADNITDTKISDVNVGDLVITHNNQLKRVISKYTAVKSGVLISSEVGDVISSKPHKFFVYHTTTRCFDWITAESIDPIVHKLVKSKLGNWVSISSINSLVQIQDHNTYTFNLQTEYDNIVCSATHEFVVFNADSGQIDRVQCQHLDHKVHFMMNFNNV